MKVSEIRALSLDEMHQKLVEMKHELFNLRFQKEIGQLENSSSLKRTKKGIARIKTILNEMARNLQETDN